MIRYFRFKSQKGNAKKDIILREKKNLFDKPIEKHISKKGNIVLFGINASGKTKRLNSIVEESKNIWKEPIIFLKATDAISEILNRNLDSESEARELLTCEGEDIEIDT